LLVSTLAILPQILLHCTLRNRLLGSVFPDETLSIQAGAASGGWFTPLSFHDVRLNDRKSDFDFSAERVQLDRGLWRLLLNRRELGTVKVTRSHVTLRSGEDGRWKIPVGESQQLLGASFDVRDAGLTLIVPWREVPIVELTGLQIRGGIAPDTEGNTILSMEPIVLADQAPVTEAASQQNLALIAPVVSQARQLEGTVSATLDGFQIPMKRDAEAASVPLQGHATVHSLTGVLKSDWLQPLAAMQSSAEPVTGSQLRIPDDTRIDFAVTDEGVVHDGLVFSLPQSAGPIAFQSAGVLRLDGTLDLALLMSLPQVINADRPFLMMLSQMAAEPVSLRVVGTVAEPRIELPENSDLLSELVRRVAPAAWQQPAPPVPEAVGNLIQDAAQPAASGDRSQLPADILQLIRSIRESRNSESNSGRPRRGDRPARRQK
jgi:hypothetical protein